MASVSFVGFQSFAAAPYNALHTLSSDTVKVALTNTAPVAATDTQFSDITEITAGSGYTAGGATVTITSSTQTAGVYTLLAGADVVWTASGGSIGPFRYIVLYNDTATNDELIGYYDTGIANTVADGDPYTFACNGVNLLSSTLS